MTLRTLCSLLAIAASPAFAQSTRPGAKPVAARDTVRVRATGAPQWGPVTLAPVWTIGQIDGPEEQSFGNVGAVAVDRQRRFYVYDGQDKRIRQYAADGKFVRVVGRSGKGPGEYGWVYSMAILDDSLLAIHDLNNARVSYFGPDGKLVRGVSEPRATWGIDNVFTTDTRGRTYLPVPRTPARGEAAMSETEMTASPLVLVLGRDGRAVDSLSLPSHLSHPPGQQFFLATADGGNYNFTVQSHHAMLRTGGYVFGTADRYRFVIQTLGAAPIVVERPWTPVSLTAEERDNWVRYADYFTEQSGGRRHYTIPDTKPAYRDLLVDADNRIWVSLYAAARKIDLPPAEPNRKSPRLFWQQAATYDIFDASGKYLGHVELPMRARVLAARGNAVWVLAKGPDDEEQIRLYTMNSPQGVK